MEKNTVYPQLSDRSTTQGDNSERPNAWIKNTKTNRGLIYKLTNAHKRQIRTQQKRK